MNRKTRMLVLFITLLIAGAVITGCAQKRPQKISGRIVRIMSFNPLTDNDVDFGVDVNGDMVSDYVVNTNSTEGLDIIGKCVGLKNRETNDSGKTMTYSAPDTIHVTALLQSDGRYFIDSVVAK